MTGINRVKTWVLIAALGGLFVALGAAFGGRSGALIALVFAFAFNFAMYWFSDRIAIMSSRSKPVSVGSSAGTRKTSEVATRSRSNERAVSRAACAALRSTDGVPPVTVRVCCSTASSPRMSWHHGSKPLSTTTNVWWR